MGNCGWILKATSYMKRKRNIMKFKRHIMRIIIFLKDVERQEEQNLKRTHLNENYFICLIRLTSWMLNWVPINPHSSILIFRHDFQTEGLKKTIFSLENAFLLDRTFQKINKNSCHEQISTKIFPQKSDNVKNTVQSVPNITPGYGTRPHAHRSLLPKIEYNPYSGILMRSKTP